MIITCQISNLCCQIYCESCREHSDNENSKDESCLNRQTLSIIANSHNLQTLSFIQCLFEPLEFSIEKKEHYYWKLLTRGPYMMENFELIRCPDSASDEPDNSWPRIGSILGLICWISLSQSLTKLSLHHCMPLDCCKKLVQKYDIFGIEIDIFCSITQTHSKYTYYGNAFS
ncbi:unnamed protein product [Moneuplotes crassus]|uniref:Uncharacterized protein n=1 Tax=Euplotes crassus TaxID=5936 RepID=A0AAD1XF32_EUPCR|nr:unnamed protein product [Moneuplotes crassus]